LRRRQNAFGEEPPLALAVVIGRSWSDQAGYRGVPVENKYFLAIFDVLDMGAEFGL
jgi:hypothetical protein